VRWVRYLLVLGPVLAVLASPLHPRAAHSLPLFSRNLGVPCAQCHLSPPRLNSAGIAFQQNGYRLPGEKGRSPWEERTAPFSVIAKLGMNLTREDSSDSTGMRGVLTTSQFTEPRLEIHSAGTLAERISFDFVGGSDGDGASPGIRAAFVRFDDVVSSGALNVRLGRFAVEAPYLSEARRNTLLGYLSPITLDARGLEINGVRSAWTWAAGLINSQRHLEEARPGTRTFNTLEDTYLWFMRDFGGQKLGARMFFDRQDSDVPIHFWLQHLQAQASGCFGSRRLLVVPAYTFNRFDDRPAPGIHDKHEIGMLEAIAVPDRGERWTLTARYEHEYRTRTPYSPEEDHQLGVMNVAFDPAPNARIAFEWSHLGDNFGGPRVSQIGAFVRVAY